MPQYLLGIDSGGTMTKAALFTADGKEVASEFSPVTMLFPEPGFTERSPPNMWEATCLAIQAVLRSSGIASEEVAAVCATGYGCGLFCIDKNGEPVYNGIVSTDSRALGVIAEWEAAGHNDIIHKTLAQKSWPGQSLVLLGWLKRYRPEVMRATNTVFFCKDYTRMCLTGTIGTDYTDAALAGFIDIHSGLIAEDLFKALDLEPWLCKLPSISRPETIAGKVTAVAARQTGLKEGTPVVTGAIDIVCSCIASGVTETTQLSLLAGTFGIHNAVRTGMPQIDPVPLAQIPYVIPDSFIAMEAGATSASNLEWNCNHVFDAEKIAAEKAGESIYDRCGRMVAARIDNPPDVVFLPYLFGGPAGEPAGFIGLNAQHERADLVYAVYEGIVYAHKRNVDILMEASGDKKPEVIRLAGGAARSHIWAQLFADVLGLPVEIGQASEFGALGASICASVGIGWSADYGDAVESMVDINMRFEPDAGKRELHDSRYARFTRVGDALAVSWSG